MPPAVKVDPVTITTASITPPETEFPAIISVDDHIMEPRELWERELPASMRERGPRVERRRAKISFSGGAVHTEYDTPDGTWCDTWLFEDLVLPMGLVYGAVDQPADVDLISPAVYEDFRPGTYIQAERLLDMDANHVEASICYPNTFPRFAGQGFSERTDKDLALASLEIYNNWMIDEWCGGDARGPAHPAHARAALGPRARGRRGAALRGEGQLRDRVHREPVRSSATRRCTAASGTRCGTRARRPTPWCRCTSARRRPCPPRPTTRRSQCRCR